MMAKKAAEKGKREAVDNRSTELESRKMAQIPEWKRQLMEKRSDDPKSLLQDEQQEAASRAAASAAKAAEKAAASKFTLKEFTISSEELSNPYSHLRANKHISNKAKTPAKSFVAANNDVNAADSTKNEYVDEHDRDPRKKFSGDEITRRIKIKLALITTQPSLNRLTTHAVDSASANHNHNSSSSNNHNDVSNTLIRIKNWETDHQQDLRLLKGRREVNNSAVRKDLSLIVTQKMAKMSPKTIEIGSRTPPTPAPRMSYENVTHVGFTPAKSSTAFKLSSFGESATDYSKLQKAGPI